MKNIHYLVVLVCLLIQEGCNQSKNTSVNTINFSDSSNTSLPNLFTNADGKIFMSWVKKIDDSTFSLNYSQLTDENRWMPSKEILRGNDWFINWADFPAIAENNGKILTHFLRNSANKKYAYDILINVFNKNNWRTGLQLHADSTDTEHGFVTILPYKNGFFISWLDGREMANNQNEHLDGHSHGGDMSLRCAFISPDGVVSERNLLDAKTCSCCQTTAAITENGPIVLYRDRSDKEIRDIAITRFLRGKWTIPKRIFEDNWKINGCPVNGPKADAIGNIVTVAWFSSANQKPEVKVVFSEDGGMKFLQPIRVSNLNPLGRVDVVLVDKDNAIVSWMEMANENALLKAIKVNKSGEVSEPITVAKMVAARKSGFPQMVKSGNNLYFAWTSVSEMETSVKTASIELGVFE